MDDSLQASGQHCYGGRRRDWCHQLANDSQTLAQSWHHQAGSAPRAVLKEGILLIFTFLEGNLVVWREIVPAAVQVSGNIEGEPGLSAELGHWSRLLRHALKSFTGIILKVPCLSEAYF